MNMRDFTKFFFFVKGVIESGTVIKYGPRPLRNDIKLHFNRIMAAATELERHVHKELGPEMAKNEEDTNHFLIDLVWNIYEMDGPTLDKFMEHMNEFELPEKEGNESADGQI